MPGILHVPFTKMQGAGNDFIVIDNRFLRFSMAELAYLARTYCPRRTGVGADGLLALDEPDEDGAHYRMRYHNADGSLAGLCGNGARCLGRFAREAGLAEDPMVFDAEAGRYRITVPPDENYDVRLFLPPPRHYNPAVRLADGAEVAYVWTGTHHAVIFVADVEAASPETDAPRIRHDPAFAPEGTNVNFVQVVDEHRLRVRTFEKGVEGETLACGTGAVAAAVVTRLGGRTSSDRLRIDARGGSLEVGLEMRNGAIGEVYLQGPAVKVFTGMIDVDPSALPS